MTNILFISSSPRGEASYSNRVASNVLENLRRAHPDAVIAIRDLNRNPLPHIDEIFAAGLATPAAMHSEGQHSRIVRSDALIDELLSADIIVIALAMINFSIPSTIGVSSLYSLDDFAKSAPARPVPASASRNSA